MKVILLQDVAKIGRKHAVVEVPDGYAQNQLIPRRLANPATPENLKAALQVAENKIASEATAITKYETTREALLKQKIIISAPNKNQQGHLFAAIQKPQVVAAINKAGIVVDPRMVELSRPIKETGEHEVKLTYGDKHSMFIIKVE